jgi:PTS system beta-glucosides-specific IIC component
MAKVAKDKLAQCPQISDVQENEGHCEIVIGSHVVTVYQYFATWIAADYAAQHNLNNTNTEDSNNQDNLNCTECTEDDLNNSEDITESANDSLMASVFSVVSGSFTPLLGVLAGSGMIKALLSVLLMLQWLESSSSTYLVLSAASNAVFYFLPILLGISAAIKMGANAYLGGAIGAALLEPNFTALIGQTDSTLMGFVFEAMNYSATVFPIFIAVLMLAWLEKHLTRYCPNNVQFFLVPMLCLLIVVPLTVALFGPFGMYIGNLIAAGINLMMSLSSVFTGALIGGIMMFLVVFGLHWAVIPVVIANLATGWDPIMAMWIPSSFAQMGVAVAIYLRSKDADLRLLAGPAAATGLLAGVTEPIIYGLIMRYRRTIPFVVIAGAVGGAINGFFQVKLNAFVFHNIFSIAAFNPMLYAVIGIASGFILALLMTLFFGFESKKNQTEQDASPVEPAMA